MAQLRAFVSISLIVALVVTSGAMAVARGQSFDAVGKIILCVGHISRVVYIDQQGEPVERPQVCPDCALHQFDQVSYARLFSGELGNASAGGFTAADALIPVQNALFHFARAPPVAFFAATELT